MRIITVLLAGTMLVGCAESMQELKARGPLQSFSSSKAVSAVGECILFAWQNQSIAGAHDSITFQPRQGGGQSVLDDSLRVVADIYRSEQTTRVDFYTNGGGTTWVTDKRESALKTCL